MWSSSFPKFGGAHTPAKLVYEILSTLGSEGNGGREFKFTRGNEEGMEGKQLYSDFIQSLQ